MRTWIALAALLVFAAVVVPLARHRPPHDASESREGSNVLLHGQVEGAAKGPAPITTAAGEIGLGAAAAGMPASASSAVASAELATLPPGLDLGRWDLGGEEATAPIGEGRVAHLTVAPALQRATERVLRGYRIPEAAVVMLDTSNNHVLVWASRSERPNAGDLCTEASAPAASVFKIVTGAALIENAGLSPDTRECYAGGGESRITQLDLQQDPKRDRWCASLGEAMGHSLNPVFARLALRNLTPTTLSATAGALGFGSSSVPFDLPVEPSAVHLPDEGLGFARTAAGFWNTTLSPLEGALLASIVANRGEVLRPTLVDSVSEGGRSLYRAPQRQALRRAVRPETALALTSMMEVTVTSGTSFRAFHDGAGHSFLPNVAVAGKTGTLTSASTKQLYTWFVGFAPSRAPEVALAVLVVNHPKWRVKANVVARDVLRAYFAEQGVPGVSRP